MDPAVAAVLEKIWGIEDENRAIRVFNDTSLKEDGPEGRLLISPSLQNPRPLKLEPETLRKRLG